MATDAPPPVPTPNWFARAFGFAKGVGGNILELARITFGGEATAERIVFFAVGMIGLVSFASIFVFMVLKEPTYALVSFLVLVVSMLILLSRMAGRIHPQPSASTTAVQASVSVPDPVVNERDAARTERDAARVAQAAAERSVQAQTKLIQCYETGVVAISAHYQKPPNRLPKLLSYEMTVTIKANGNAEVLERRKLKAVGNVPQSFLIDEFRGSLTLDSFLDLNLDMKVHAGTRSRGSQSGCTRTRKRCCSCYCRR
jgi:membrane protein implicated in regulation of membrane protease activity